MGQVFDILSYTNIITIELAERIKKSVGFRNLAVHNYALINWEIIYAIATKRLDDFKQFAIAIAHKLNKK